VLLPSLNLHDAIEVSQLRRDTPRPRRHCLETEVPLSIGTSASRRAAARSNS
jgi:hypothetical protein